MYASDIVCNRILLGIGHGNIYKYATPWIPNVLVTSECFQMDSRCACTQKNFPMRGGALILCELTMNDDSAMGHSPSILRVLTSGTLCS